MKKRYSLCETSFSEGEETYTYETENPEEMQLIEHFFDVFVKHHTRPDGTTCNRLTREVQQLLANGTDFTSAFVDPSEWKPLPKDASERDIMERIEALTEFFTEWSDLYIGNDQDILSYQIEEIKAES